MGQEFITQEERAKDLQSRVSQLTEKSCRQAQEINLLNVDMVQLRAINSNFTLYFDTLTLQAKKEEELNELKSTLTYAAPISAAAAAATELLGQSSAATPSSVVTQTRSDAFSQERAGDQPAQIQMQPQTLLPAQTEQKPSFAAVTAVETEQLPSEIPSRLMHRNGFSTTSSEPQ